RGDETAICIAVCAPVEEDEADERANEPDERERFATAGCGVPDHDRETDEREKDEPKTSDAFTSHGTEEEQSRCDVDPHLDCHRPEGLGAVVRANAPRDAGTHELEELKDAVVLQQQQIAEEGEGSSVSAAAVVIPPYPQRIDQHNQEQRGYIRRQD